MIKRNLALLIFVFFGINIVSADDKCGYVAEKLYELAEEDVKITRSRDELAIGDLSLENTLKSVRKKNSQVLDRILDECGWPVKNKYGDAANTAAWLVAQHADEEPEFQSKVLNILLPLVKKDEFSAIRYAYLQDRYELKRSGKQIYGTQLMVDSDGIRLPENEVDSLDDVNRRRAQLGMETIQEYLFRAREKSKQK
ncbi:hypothetical protein IFT68_23130 [Oxalobacteraceae sp. CFBP 13730]|nr:hypothetical protein [Oxalobacteraceae sp. CFBP 13730]